MQEVVLRQAGCRPFNASRLTEVSLEKLLMQTARLRHEGREVWGLRRPRSQTLGNLADEKLLKAVAAKRKAAFLCHWT